MPHSPMANSERAVDRARVLTVGGVLDDTTYLQLRDTIIKVALEEPRAVIVDVTDLQVPAESAWSAFSSARWHVSVWPAVPVVLVCPQREGRDALARNGITRYVPVYPTVESARAAVCDCAVEPRCRRVHSQFPALHSSLRRARKLVAECLVAWSHAELIPVASIVVDVLVENVLEHTQCPPGLLIENRGETVTIAVEDDCRKPAGRHEDPYRGGETVSGLAVVAAVARAWGSTPVPGGKTVWAVIGPENCI